MSYEADVVACGCLPYDLGGNLVEVLWVWLSEAVHWGASAPKASGADDAASA